MRAYKFLNQTYGLKSLCERRLRRTRINELNDPFELRPYDLTDPKVRWAFNAFRDAMSQKFGLLCFSAEWCDPLIWAHYSDKHKGLCLGFDIREVEEIKTKKVCYISTPLQFPVDFLHLNERQQLPVADRMIYTKYRNWRYEQEIRTWTDLDEEFFNFCDGLQLAEVIIGAECNLPITEITSALGSLADNVSVKKVRASHDAFQIVEDEIV